MKLVKQAAAIAAAAMISAAMLPDNVLAAPDPAIFGQLPAVSDAAISPDGKRVAILQNYQGNPVVNIIDLEKFEAGDRSGAKVVGMAEGVKPDYVKWVGNRYVIVSVSELGMYRNTPIYSGYLHSIDTKTMKARVLKDGRSNMAYLGPSGPRQFNNEVLDWLEDDPESIIMQFPNPKETNSYPSVWKMKVSNGGYSLVRRYTSGTTDWITDNEGTPRVGIFWLKNGREMGWRIQNPETEDWSEHNQYPELDPQTMSIAAIIDGGRKLILKAYRGRDTLGLHVYDVVAKEFTEALYQNDAFDVGGAILSEDGTSVVGASYLGDSLEKVLFDDYDSALEEALAVFEDFEVRFIDQSNDSDQLLLEVSGPSEPGGLFLYRRGKQPILLLQNRAELADVDLANVMSTKYTARDGQQIPAYVTVPADVTGRIESLPFIVLPHGGPYARDARRFDWLAQFFASQGYGVLQMNFRGSQGLGKDFAEAGRGNWVVMQNDVEDGMRWLLDKGYADPERSCIAGWSYGGYAALMGVANDPDLYKCAIAIAALSDIPEAIADGRRYERGNARVERTFGALMGDRSLMQENNPVDRAADIQVPVFMAHGTLDASVQFDQFKVMKDRLERAGVDGTYLEFENEDHYMSNQSNRQAMMDGIAAFLTKVNGSVSQTTD